MQIRLDYGKQGLVIEAPEARVAGVLGLRPAPALEDPPQAVRYALLHPVGAPPLDELACGKKSACVVISDITRPVPNHLILPPMLCLLEQAGVPRSGITILVATGTHRGNTPEELTAMVGADIVRDYRIVNHDARDPQTHTYLGQTPRGVPIWVDTRFLEAEVRISVALIEPHFMAGFSGGRKSICPGICAMETVQIWHGPRFIGHELAESGSVDGNPVHEDSLFVARKAGLNMICDVSIDGERRITGVYAGEVEAAWLHGVAAVREVVQAPLEERVDVVLTTTAGHPLDLTFYQAVKGMVGAMPAVNEGGTILIAAECAEGIGGHEFTETLLGLNADRDALEEFIERTYDPSFFVPDQWEVHELLKAVRHAEVMMVCDGIPADQLARCFVTPVPSVEEGIRLALERHGPDARLAIIPKGPYVTPVITGRAG